MLVQCKRCGGPLDVRTSDRFVKCHYCDAVNKTKSAKTIAMETPPNWAPPPTWQPPQGARAQAQVFVYHATAVSGTDRAKAQSGCIAAIVLPAMLLPLGIGMCAAIQDSSCAIGGPNYANAPRYGTLTSAELAAGRLVSGSVTPSSSTSTYANAGAGCNGSIEGDPTLRLDLAGPSLVTLETTSLEDTVLVVREPDGSFHCDDDSAGSRNARLTVDLPAGVHAVWVGSFETASTTSFEVRASSVTLAAPPNAIGLVTEGPGSLGVVDLGAQPSGRVRGNLAAVVDASRADSSCSGRVNAVADLALIATAQTSITLDATSSVDTVLVVRGPDGQFHCNDDGGGSFNPQVTFLSPPGTTHVWVGPLSMPGTGTFELSYTATVLPEGVDLVIGLAPGAVPTLRAAPVTDADLAGRALELAGEAHGAVEMQPVDSRCRGAVALAPHLRMELSRAHDLELRTRSREDLTLAIRGPDGAFLCDDDSGGSGQPRVRARLAPGTHHVWVGQFHSGSPVPFTLLVQSR